MNNACCSKRVVFHNGTNLYITVTVENVMSIDYPNPNNLLNYCADTNLPIRGSLHTL